MSDVEQRIKELGEFIRSTNDKIISGSDDAIKQLEKRVVEFCKYASSLPFEEIEGLHSDIEFLADYLKKVSVHLNLTQDGVMEQIKQLNARKKAARAYGVKKPN